MIDIRLKHKDIHGIRVFFIKLGDKLAYFFNWEGYYYGMDYDWNRKEDTREEFEKAVEEMTYFAKCAVRKYKYKIKTTLKDIIDDGKVEISLL